MQVDCSQTFYVAQFKYEGDVYQSALDKVEAPATQPLPWSDTVIAA